MDVQLKGPRRTPFSRDGDGRAGIYQRGDGGAWRADDQGACRGDNPVSRCAAPPAPEGRVQQTFCGT
jgi:hypothetical protein